MLALHHVALTTRPPGTAVTDAVLLADVRRPAGHRAPGWHRTSRTGVPSARWRRVRLALRGGRRLVTRPA